MKIVILSDVHDNVSTLKDCLKWCKKNCIEQIICCGDLTNSQTLKELASFLGIIHLVKGNAEIYDEKDLEKYKNIIYYGEIGIIKIEGINFGICHEPFHFESLSKKNARIIFYGHTHKPWIEEKKNIKFINPGTLSGMFSSATFAFFDTEKKVLELKSVYGLDQ